MNLHTDHVGSLLRPAELLDARQRFSDGVIPLAELESVENTAIDSALAMQERAGCEVVTDGEYRRLSFQSVMLEAATGFGEWDLGAFLWGDWYGSDLEPWHRPRPENLGAVGKLVRVKYPAAREYSYLRGRTDRVVKITLPSPSLLANFWSAERSVHAYPSLDGFLEDVAALVCGEVAELARLGCRYIQLDAPHYPMLMDEATREFYERQGWDAEQWLRRGVELDNAVVASCPEVTFGMHLCRGNQGSRWLLSAGYDWIAQHLFEHVGVHRLVTTKSNSLETRSELIRRIQDAARYMDLERLALSPQCGFSTSVVGNEITPECQTAKLQLIAETAEAVWR